MAREIRTVLRNLLRSPVFSLITIATLAIGIAANTAIFAVVHAVLIEPLPYPEPERLVGVASLILIQLAASNAVSNVT